MARLLRLGAAAFAGLSLSCVWVSLDVPAEDVWPTNADEVAGCDRLTITTVSTKPAAWYLARSRKSVAEELENLARNEAAKKGGDSIVPLGPPEAGEQKFAIYDCGD
jgi:hypothetical protein